MLWLIGLTVFGLSLVASGVDSEQSDDELEADEEELWDSVLVGLEEDRQGLSEGRECIDESDVEHEGNVEIEDCAEGIDRQIVEGTGGKDLLFSDGGDDEHFYEIHGNDGNDRIYASDGVKVFGGAGNDMIVLRSVDEGSLPVEVSGDSGSDAFLFEGSNESSAMQGLTTISDYHPGEDIVGVILEDENFSDGQVDGEINYILKDITAEVNENGTMLTIFITRQLDPNCAIAHDEVSTDLTHKIFLSGVTEFNPEDFVIVNDWIAFGNEFLGPGDYSLIASLSSP